MAATGIRHGESSGSYTLPGWLTDPFGILSHGRAWPTPALAAAPLIPMMADVRAAARHPFVPPDRRLKRVAHCPLLLRGICSSHALLLPRSTQRVNDEHV